MGSWENTEDQRRIPEASMEHSGESACLPPMWTGLDTGSVPYVS